MRRQCNGIGLHAHPIYHASFRAKQTVHTAHTEIYRGPDICFLPPALQEVQKVKATVRSNWTSISALVQPHLYIPQVHHWYFKFEFKNLHCLSATVYIPLYNRNRVVVTPSMHRWVKLVWLRILSHTIHAPLVEDVQFTQAHLIAWQTFSLFLRQNLLPQLYRCS